MLHNTTRLNSNRYVRRKYNHRNVKTGHEICSAIGLQIFTKNIIAFRHINKAQFISCTELSYDDNKLNWKFAVVHCLRM